MAKGPFYEQGVYVGEVLQQGISKAGTGTFQFVLTFKVLGVADLGDQTSYTPSKSQFQRTLYMALTPKTAEYVVPVLESMGFHEESILALEPGNPNHHSFVGQTFDFYCSHENGQDGNLREKWSVARSQKLPEVKPLEDREKRALDNLFGKALKGKKPAKSVQPEDETQIQDDDVPF